MKQILVTGAILRDTIEALQQAGRDGRECVALWLGDSVSDVARITRVHVPAQLATGDSFRIPRESVTALLQLVEQTGLAVAAQVHTHPARAFHSLADDDWAIVRHVGAISIVIPKFALATDVTTFWGDAALFQLSAANEWERIPPRQRAAFVRESP